jgi:hypothetical protein
MSSGMVVATNAVAAIPEFTDPSCAILAEPEDAAGLASGIAATLDDPALFMARSRAAAKRIRETIAMNIILPQELGLLAGDKT